MIEPFLTNLMRDCRRRAVKVSLTARRAEADRHVR